MACIIWKSHGASATCAPRCATDEGFKSGRTFASKMDAHSKRVLRTLCPYGMFLVAIVGQSFGPVRRGHNQGAEAGKRFRGIRNQKPDVQRLSGSLLAPLPVSSSTMKARQWKDAMGLHLLLCKEKTTSPRRRCAPATALTGRPACRSAHRRARSGARTSRTAAKNRRTGIETLLGLMRMFGPGRTCATSSISCRSQKSGPPTTECESDAGCPNGRWMG
jgi:hypothetical protein